MSGRINLGEIKKKKRILTHSWPNVGKSSNPGKTLGQILTLIVVLKVRCLT